MRGVLGVLVAVGVLVAPAAAVAGTGPYFVLYDHRTHAPGEVELMPLVDLDSDRAGHSSLNYLMAVDVAVARRLHVSLMAEGHLAPGEGYRASGMRVEARYRLFEAVPLNPTLFVELEDVDLATHYQLGVSGRVHEAGHGEEGGHGPPAPRRERLVQPRLILSDELGPLLLSFNWISQLPLSDEPLSFGYAFGASYPIVGGHHGPAPEGEEADHTETRLGVELYGGLGDTHDFGPNPHDREHYAAVDVMHHFRGHWMMKAGGAFGLTEVSHRNLMRVGIGYEF